MNYIIGLLLTVATTSPIAMQAPTSPVEPPSVEGLHSIPFDLKLSSKAQIEDYIVGTATSLNLPVVKIREISKCESGMRQFKQDGELLRGIVNSKDVGLFQVNEFYHLEDSRKMGLDIHTAKGNIDYSMHLYSKYGDSPWIASKPCWSHTDSSSIYEALN